MKILKNLYGKEKNDEYFKLLLSAGEGFLVETLIGKCVVSKKGLFPKLNLPDSSLRKTHVFCCVSTQIGCVNTCRFCNNRKKRFVRNLSLSEIKQEVDEAQKISRKFFGQRLEEIQFGGIGEPLLNLENVIRTIEIFHKEDQNVFFGFPTTGLPLKNFQKLIRKFSDKLLPIYLQISLHASNDILRKKIMGVGNIRQIIQLAQEYSEKVKSPVIINYLMIRQVNDQICFADELIRLLDQHSLTNKVVVKLSIPNDTNTKFSCPSDEKRIDEFKERLVSAGIDVAVFVSGGKSVKAGCGQLTVSHQKIQK